MKKIILLFVLIAASVNVFSEDIELYLLDANLIADSKPQVLLIVDTSGSMADTQLIKTPYNPNAQYGYLGTYNEKSTSHIYYTVGSTETKPTVDAANENRRFLANLNSCSTAQSRLNTMGFYTGKVREYSFQGNTGSWKELNSTTGNSITIIDCEDDITLDRDHLSDIPATAVEHNENTVMVNDVATTKYGYPVDGLGSPDTPVYYGSITQANANWSGKTVTLYTDNYLRWKQGTKFSDDNDIGFSETSRIDIAKDTLADLINSIPSVKFGLEVYNINNSNNNANDAGHGGRVAFGIQDMTATAKESLLDIIQDDLHAAGSTPLCESYYEAYRYLAGLPVKYGDQDYSAGLNNNTQYHTHTLPDRDTSIEASGTYISPYQGCSDKVFVILITDGIPQRDSAADSAITTAITNADPAVTATAVDGNSLPILAQYMSTNDINANKAGKQTAQLYTIGFSSGSEAAVPLLEAAAENGGGEYYDASDPTELGSRLQEALTAILSVNTSFTAPSVVTNSADRTEKLDSVYYASFIANDSARWVGNLKKLKVTADGQVDRDGNPAINENGGIKATAKTFWVSSTEADGGDVTQGGVVGMFNYRTTDRVVYIDNSNSTSFIPLNTNNLAITFGDAAAAHAVLGVSNSADAQSYLDWAEGIWGTVTQHNTTNGETTIVTYNTYRPDLFGDPLHSKPVAINYGGDGSSPDVRILIGTNAGALHMFKDQDDEVDESWAFMPKELLSNVKILKENLPSSAKVYGVDGRITTHIIDKNGDGTINTDDDTVLAFFGLRRGGSSYYALDLSNPDEPDLLWKIDANTPGFEELGQTWSQPQVGYSRYNMSTGTDSKPKPVLIFGGGYSIAKDLSGPGENDSVGRGIYMVDAASGELLWSVTPGEKTAQNTQFTGFTDSIPSKISVLDSDGDGLIDRLYAGDTGGNVFRVDMPGDDPFSDDTPWTAFKLAELGGASESPKTNLNDRRFFDAPSIVRTFFTDTLETTVDSVTVVYKQEIPYDAILIGSGDRSTPTSTDTDDKFFLIRDKNVITQSFVEGAESPMKDIPTVIRYDDLYDFTDNPYGDTMSESQLRNLNLAVSTKSGWLHDYSSVGEKSTAGAFAVDGVAYFTSFTPGSDNQEDEDVCELVTGQGSLYAVDLYQGTTINSWRKIATIQGMPDTPVITVSPSNYVNNSGEEGSENNSGSQKPSLLLLTGAEAIEVNSSLKTSRSYQYVTE